MTVSALAAEPVPLPRPRPDIWPEPRSFAEAVAGLDFNPAAVSDRPTDCDDRLAAMAEIAAMPRLIGPEACGGADMVELEAVRLPDQRRVAIQPTALLHCGMGESVPPWLREGASPPGAAPGLPLASIENYDSY